MEFNIVKTNIVNVPAEAIVLPANTHLREGSGTSRSIFEAAGRKELTKACAEIGHCDMGMAVPTPAYRLNADYIIHAVVPRWVDGEHNEYELLTSAYLAALNIADVMECESIAFPLLASGNNGFDKKLAFQIARESFESFTGNHLKEITLVIYGDTMETLVKSWGYSATIIRDTQLEERKAKREERQEQLAAAGKIVIGKAFEKAAIWLGDEENQEKLKMAAIMVLKTAITKISAKKKQVEENKTKAISSKQEKG